MDEYFPFLIEHGPLVWRLSLVGLVVLVLGAIWAIRYASARHGLRAALRRVRSNHGAIRGTLRGGAATTVAVRAYFVEKPPETAQASWRADQLWLETADRKIELVGPVVVVAGTRYAGKRRTLPALRPAQREAVTTALPWAKKPIHSALAVHLTPGDEIEVRGSIESQAGQGETTAREADIAWTLRGEDAPLQLASIAPVAARLPLGFLRTAIAVLLTVGAGTLAQHALGERWLDQCMELDGEHEAGEAPVELDNGHACVLAASIPKHRERGLYFLHQYLDEHPYRDAASVARFDAITREVEDCSERVQRLYYRQRFEAAIEEAQACGISQSWYEHESLVMLGRFEEALKVYAPDLGGGRPAVPALSTLIAAGAWAQAAVKLRAEPKPEDFPEIGVYRDCVADWFAHLGGDHAAEARLRVRAAGSDAALCAEVLSELEPDRRTYWLTLDSRRFSRAKSVLGAAAGVFDYDHLDRPEDILLHPEDGDREAASLWLPQLGAKPWQRAVALRWTAVKQTLDNKPDAALATAASLRELADELRVRDLDEEYHFNLRPIDALVPAIQLYTPTIFDFGPSTGEAWLFQYERLLIRSRQSLDGQEIKYNEEFTRAVRTARTGDGRKLHAAMRKRWSSWEDADVIAVLPHVTNVREALARELPYMPLNNYIYGDHVFRNALNAFTRRELLEAVGANDHAARWDETYRRFDRVFSDRKKLVGLVLTK